MQPDYSIEDGKLVIRDSSNGEIVWKGYINACHVQNVLPLTSTPDCLVLLDPTSSRHPTFDNLVRVTPEGHVVWRAQLTRSHDAFVDMLLTDTTLKAWTWDGYQLEIDPATGHSREIGFTK